MPLLNNSKNNENNYNGNYNKNRKKLYFNRLHIIYFSAFIVVDLKVSSKSYFLLGPK